MPLTKIRWIPLGTIVNILWLNSIFKRFACSQRPKDARKYLEKYKRLDAAIDSYYNDPNEFASSSKRSDTDRTARLNAIFDKYKGTVTLNPSYSILT